MSNLYGVIFTVLGALAAVGLTFLIRWANDASFTGWRLQRWEERGVEKSQREWRAWFAWRPVRTVSGELVWWCTVYRKLGNDYTDMEDWSWYYYGTVFDVLAE